MMNIPFSPPDITEQEINEVCAALRSGWITTGPKTKDLERQVAAYCGRSSMVSYDYEKVCKNATCVTKVPIPIRHWGR